MKRDDFKAVLLELLLDDPDVADAVLAARQRAEGRDMAFMHQHAVLSSGAYRRAKEALRKLQEADQVFGKPLPGSGGEDL